MKHWKKIKKREKRERKYIIRFLRLHHVQTTIPPKWDMIHVVKLHNPIRTMDDIKTVALMYGKSDEGDASPTDLMARLGITPTDLIATMNEARASGHLERPRPGMPEWVKDGLMLSF